MSIHPAELLACYDHRLLGDLIATDGLRADIAGMTGNPRLLKACAMHDTPRDALMQLVQWRVDECKAKSRMERWRLQACRNEVLGALTCGKCGHRFRLGELVFGPLTDKGHVVCRDCAGEKGFALPPTSA